LDCLKSSNLRIITGLGDNSVTVRVADENDRSVLLSNRAPSGGDVVAF
jgi:hypothetical protein